MPRLSGTVHRYNTPQNARTEHVISWESACCYDNIPLHSAVKEDNAEKLEYLLGIPNIDLNYRSEVTALYLSLQLLRSDSFIIRLIEAGCDPNVTTVNNDAPLHIAINRLTTKVALKLIEKGADVNAVDAENRTPLHYAVENNNLESVCMLLYHGAAVNLCDMNCMTPLEIALKYESLEVISVLIGYYDSKALLMLTLQLQRIPDIILKLIFYVVNANVNCMDRDGSNLLLSIHVRNNELFKFIWSKLDHTILLKCTLPFLLNYICYCKFPPSQWLECLYLILESPVADDLIEHGEKSQPIFSKLVIALIQTKIEKKDRVAAIYLFLSLGCSVCDYCFTFLYQAYGFQEELEALIYCSSRNLNNYEPEDYFCIPLIIKTLNFEVDREDIFEWSKDEIEKFDSDDDDDDDDNKTVMKEIAKTLGLFWLPADMKAELSDLYEGSSEVWRDVSKILNERGSVPSLCELSRNQMRRYIRENFKIEKTYHIYDVLKKFKLPQPIYDIICFKKPIY